MSIIRTTITTLPLIKYLLAVFVGVNFTAFVAAVNDAQSTLVALIYEMAHSDLTKNYALNHS